MDELRELNTDAIAEAEAGRHDRARTLFEQGAQLEDFTCLFNLGALCEREQDTAGARRWFDRALRVRPDDAETCLRLAWTMDGVVSLSDRALELLERAADLGAPDAYRSLAVLHARAERLDAAADCLSRAGELGDDEAYLRLGYLHIQRGDGPAAQAAFTVARQRDVPEAEEALMWLERYPPPAR